MKKGLLFLFIAWLTITNGQAQTCGNNAVKNGSFTITSVISRAQIRSSFHTYIRFISIERPMEVAGNSIGNFCIADKFAPRDWHKNWHLGTGEGPDISIPEYNGFLLFDMPTKSKLLLWEQKVDVLYGLPYTLTFKICNIEENGTGAQDIAVLYDDGVVSDKVIVSKTDADMVSAISIKPPSADPWGMEWTTITRENIYFLPSNGSSAKFTDGATLRFVAYDTYTVGYDIGLDDICLSTIPESQDITVNNICIGDDFYADYTGTETIVKWFIDNVEYNNTNDPLVLTQAVHQLAEGQHSVMIELNNGTNNHREYKYFQVYDPPTHKAHLAYEWDYVTNPIPDLILDKKHQGAYVSFNRYTDDTKTIGQPINPNVDGDYIAPMDCDGTATTPNDYFYICKTVDYSCTSVTPSTYTDCDYVCPDVGCGLSLTASAVTINGAGKYEVTFTANKSGAGTEDGYFWTFGDGTALPVSGVAGSQVTHAYDELGTYKVCAVAEMDNGCNYDGCEVFKVCIEQDDALTPQIACLGNVPADLDADPNSNDPANTAYQWILDGKEVGTGQVLSFNPDDLNRAFTYQLELNKTSDCFDERLTTEVLIAEPEDISFDYGLDENNGMTVWVKASRAPNAAEQFEWFAEPLGGGGSQIFNSPVPPNIEDPGTFDASSFGAGDIKVRLKVTDSLGCVLEIEQIICVAQDPMDCCDCPN